MKLRVKGYRVAVMKLKTNIFQYLILTILGLTAVAGSWSLYSSPSTRGFGAVLLVVSLLCTVITLFMMIFSGRTTKKYISSMTTAITKTEKESLNKFPAPVFIIDDKKTIVWCNEEFEREVYPDEDPYGLYIEDLADFDLEKIYQPNGNIIHLNDRFYRVRAIMSKDSGMTMSMVYFNDITDYVSLDFEYKQSRPSVLLIVVDNYDDLLQNVRESEKAHILVELEKLMENFIDQTTGVIRKLSSTKFMIIMEERHLSKVIENRFDILDKARSIAVNDRLTITLSIGVGHCAKTLAESEMYAKQALDMCLGRGGDQAAVKTVNGFEFFGGVSKGVEKQTKVKTRIIANAIKELVASHNSILIMGHSNGDLDSVGSATGLCAVFRKMGTASYVVVNPERNLAKPLINYEISKEHVNYYISPQLALQRVTPETLLVIVDTHNPDFLDSKELYEACEKVVVIDHHRRMVNCIDNSVIFYHEPLASSASEMVAELIQYLGNEVSISAGEAEALLAGIMLDTKNFVMRTGVRTFEAAAFLRKLGADTISVKGLFSSSIETYQQKSMLITNSEIHRGCAVATARATSSDMRIAAPQAADELLGIDGVKASFVMFEENGVINISARSLGGFNVQLVMEALGGGGHQTMAGAQLNTTLREARVRLVHAIDDFIEKSTAKN